MGKGVQISVNVQRRLQQALEHESPRGMILLSLSWIDHILERKLATEFGKGNSKEREALFAVGGPFHGLSAKISVAHCAGWIGANLLHDLKLLRDIRNSLAHRIEPCSPEADEIREKLERLKTPHEVYSDWGAVRAAEVPNGVILYSGEKPDDAGKDLSLPGAFALKLGIPAVVGVLSRALEVELEPAAPDGQDVAD